MRNVLETQDNWPLWQWKVLVTPCSPERDPIQEAQSAYGQLHAAQRKLAFVGQVKDPGSNLLWAKALG
ncbi:hypothetical protein R69927_00139 [Paraburkholderia domus]|nr:hypothetical protein R69927_00139 [Paraburkholderia domus]